MTETYLTITEVSKMLHTPESTIRWWRHKKHGPPAIKMGRRIFFPESRLKSWIKAQQDADPLYHE